jgi:Gas vesicle protein G
VDLFSLIVGLPLAPLRGVIRVGEILRDQAERELYDPASARRQLEEADEARAAGKISEEEKARAENEIVGRLVDQPGLPERTGRAGSGRAGGGKEI